MNEETAIDTTVVDPDVTKFTGELLSPRTTPRVAEDDREERIAAEVSAFFKDLDNDFTSRSENRSYNIISSNSKSKVPVLNMEDDSFRYTATGMLVQKSMEIPIIVQWPDSTFEYTFSSEPSNIKFGISFIAAVEEEDDIDDVDIEVIEEMTVLKASNDDGSTTSSDGHSTLTHQYNPTTQSPFLNSISSNIDSDGTLVHTGKFTVPDCGVIFFMFDVDNESNWYSPFVTQEYKLSYIIDVLIPSFSTIDTERTKLARYMMNSNEESASRDMMALEDGETAIRRTLEETMSIEKEVDLLLAEISDKQADKDILMNIQQDNLSIIEEGYSKVNGLCLRLLNRYLLSKVISYLQPHHCSDLSSVCKYWAKLVASNRLFGLPEKTVTNMCLREEGEEQDDSDKQHTKNAATTEDVVKEGDDDEEEVIDTPRTAVLSLSSQQSQATTVQQQRGFSRPLQHVQSSIKPTTNDSVFNTPSTMRHARDEDDHMQFRTKSTAELMELQLQKMRGRRSADNNNDDGDGGDMMERSQIPLSPSRVAKNQKILHRGTYLDDRGDQEKRRKRGESITMLPTGNTIDLSEVDPALSAKLQQYLAKMDKVLREKRRLKKILLLWTENFKLKYSREPRREDKIEFAEGYYNEYSEQKKKSKHLLMLIERLTANMKLK